MQKQISYPTFFSRIFSFSIDTVWIFFLTHKIVQNINLSIMHFVYQDFFMKNSELINPTQSETFIEFMLSRDFSEIILLNLLMFLIQSIFIGSCFIACWSYLGYTPGTLLINSKLVDQNTMTKPSFFQSIKRFYSCWFLFGLGIFRVFFSNNRQALHDKVAGVMLIKR